MQNSVVCAAHCGLVSVKKHSFFSIEKFNTQGLQEATRYYLEIFGNTLVRPATAKYLVQHCSRLIDIPTSTISCSWLSLDRLKHKDKDRLEAIFK